MHSLRRFKCVYYNKHIYYIIKKEWGLNVTMKKLGYQISVKKMPTAHTKQKTSGLDRVSGGVFLSSFHPPLPPTASWYNPDCPPGLPKSAQNGSGRLSLSLGCTGAWSSSTCVLVTLIADVNRLLKWQKKTSWSDTRKSMGSKNDVKLRGWSHA